MTSFVKPGTRTLAVLLGISVMATGAYAQQAAAAGNPVATKPDVQSAGGGYAVDQNGQPPSPVGTVPLLYPRLVGTWAGTTPSPSLSEQFNKLLPKWLQFIAHIDPFTYAVHGFKSILIKDGGFTAIRWDLLFLVTFGIATLLAATPLFKRTL